MVATVASWAAASLVQEGRRDQKSHWGPATASSTTAAHSRPAEFEAVEVLVRSPRALEAPSTTLVAPAAVIVSSPAVRVAASASPEQVAPPLHAQERQALPERDPVKSDAQAMVQQP